MRKVRAILRLCLFLFGVILTFASFFISQVEQTPWVLRIVSPKSVRGMIGVRTLARENLLQPSDKGFQEISNIVKMRLIELHPDEDWDKVNVLKYEPEGKQAITGMGIELGGVKVRASLSNGRGVKLRTDYLKSEFYKIRKSAIFRCSLGLLILGVVVVQIPLFFIESVSSSRNIVDGKRLERLSHVPPL